MRNDVRVLHLVMVCLLMLILSGPTLSDEVLITNGDRLTGDIVRQDNETLRLKTSYVGTLEIKWADIVEVVLDGPTTVLLDDGKTVQVESFKRVEDEFVLLPEGSAKTITVPASNVKVIEPEPWELGQGHKFTGRINISIDNERGNSESNEFDLDFNLSNKWKKNNLLVFGQAEYDTTRGFTTTDKWSVMANLDHTFRGNWYYVGAAMFKKDKFADLQLRSMYGGGIGYRFYESKIKNLKFELGPYYLKDNFYSQPSVDFWGPAWFLDYDQKVWKQRLQIYHRQTGYVAASGGNKFLWRSWTGVRVPLISGIVGSAEYEIDYDSDPAFDAETTDQTFKLKLGYKW